MWGYASPRSHCQKKWPFSLIISPRALEPSYLVNRRKSLSPTFTMAPRKESSLWVMKRMLPTWGKVNAPTLLLSPFSATDLQRPHLVKETSSRRPEIFPPEHHHWAVYGAALLVKEPPGWNHLTNKVPLDGSQEYPIYSQSYVLLGQQCTHGYNPGCRSLLRSKHRRTSSTCKE